MSRKTIWIIVVIAVIVVAGGAYALIHKSSPNSSTNTKTAASSTTKSNTASGTNPANVVQTKSAPNVGSYLAGANGNALYTYGADTAGVSNCTGSCTSAWPAYAPGPTSGLPANVTVITRSDGSKQYAYKDMPLYTFTSDATGAVTGDGVANFSVAKP